MRAHVENPLFFESLSSFLQTVVSKNVVLNCETSAVKLCSRVVRICVLNEMFYFVFVFIP